MNYSDYLAEFNSKKAVSRLSAHYRGEHDILRRVGRRRYRIISS